MMFDRLQALRTKLASIPAFACDAETRQALVAAIDDLDDAMVQDVRAQRYHATIPKYVPDLSESAGSATVGGFLQ